MPGSRQGPLPPLHSPVMLLTLAAYAVTALHFAFVGYVLLGGLLGLRWVLARVVHVPVFLYALTIEAVRFPCPLTLLEKDLRFLAGLPNYAGGFLGHYVEPHLSDWGVPPLIHDHLGYWTVALNALLYAGIVRRWRRGMTGAASRPGGVVPPPAG